MGEVVVINLQQLNALPRILIISRFPLFASWILRESEVFLQKTNVQMPLDLTFVIFSSFERLNVYFFIQIIWFAGAYTRTYASVWVCVCVRLCKFVCIAFNKYNKNNFYI